MDPRFRKNHQLHMLLKKRTCMSDNELYEMMRSRNVYRAQNDLRRELDRRLEAIKQDQKVKIANFMVQRATFVKMATARQKSMRHLLDVKRELGGEFVEDEAFIIEDGTENEFDSMDFPIRHESIDEITERDLRYKNDYHHENKESVLAQSVNKEWMDNVMKEERSDKGNDATSKTNKVKVHVDHFDKKKKELHHTLKERYVDDEGNSTTLQNKESNMLCTSHRKIKKKPQDENIPSETTSKSLPKIKITKEKKHFKSECSTNSNDDSFQKENSSLHPHDAKMHPKESNASVHHLPKLPEPQERERTVSMLFVEKDEDNDRLDLVSPFDVEAYIKYHRQNRGHSIIISSCDLHHHVEHDEQKEIPDSKEKQTKKKMPSRKRLNSTSWGVKGVEGINSRERSKQWYEKFLATRNSKKHSIKLYSTEPEHYKMHHSDPLICHKTEKADLWNTSASSDSQISTDLYELKLQRLKQHCQDLSVRVSQFVST